ncbi:hypothetical protein [Aureimonas sp. AU40]|uniref:hypothetical protein n=1 Tax=Aureimonas sp. AU40 TaxID=1637747 RepID=UPI00078589C1|nr:hypothetical protein [Aureimonas sp. AU40]
MSDTAEPNETQDTGVPAIQVRPLIDAAQLKKDIAYSTTDLSTAMSNQASLFSDYGVIAAKASFQVNRIETTLKQVESVVYRKLRDEASQAGTKITEAQLTANVAIHRQVRAVKGALNEAKQIETIAKHAVEAFRHRRDMLIQEGLISREEMKGELTIRRKNIAEEESKTQRDQVLERLRQAGQVD